MIAKTRQRLKRISEQIFRKSINSCLLPLIICAVIMVIFQHENQTQRPANAASEWFIHYYFRKKQFFLSWNLFLLMWESFTKKGSVMVL